MAASGVISPVDVSAHPLSRLVGLAFVASACGGPPEPEVQRAERAPSRSLKATRSVERVAPPPIPPEDVLFGLRSALPDLRSCLTAPGAVRVEWLVDEKGRSSDFEVVWTEQQVDADVLPCLAALIEERSFDVPDDARTGLASWTFVRDLQALHREGPSRKRRRTSRNQGVQFDPPGRLDAAQVDGVVQNGMRLYAHCLRAAVEEESSVGGRLALSWLVDEDGRPREVTDAGSDIDNEAVVDCAAECFYALEFPPPSGGSVKVTYALLFNED